MENVTKRLFDHQLRDIAGTRVAGKICVSDPAVNEIIGELIATLTQTGKKAEAQHQISGKGTALPPPADLLKALSIDRLHYRTEEGKTILEINVGIKAT